MGASSVIGVTAGSSALGVALASPPQNGQNLAVAFNSLPQLGHGFVSLSVGCSTFCVLIVGVSGTGGASFKDGTVTGMGAG